MGTNDDIEWLDSNTTMKRVAATMGKREARLAIASRAHDGLLRTRASRFIAGSKSLENCDLPKTFWWAGGSEALIQNWVTGDFSTWIRNKAHWKAYGVSFCADDIDAMLPVPLSGEAKSSVGKATVPAQAGRRPAAWWDDLWVEICVQMHAGNLQPKNAADITKAMLTWVEHNGHTAGETTIKERAGKLFRALEREGGN